MDEQQNFDSVKHSERRSESDLRASRRRSRGNVNAKGAPALLPLPPSAIVPPRVGRYYLLALNARAENAKARGDGGAKRLGRAATSCLGVPGWRRVGIEGFWTRRDLDEARREECDFRARSETLDSARPFVFDTPDTPPPLSSSIYIYFCLYLVLFPFVSLSRSLFFPVPPSPSMVDTIVGTGRGLARDGGTGPRRKRFRTYRAEKALARAHARTQTPTHTHTRSTTRR